MSLIVLAAIAAGVAVAGAAGAIAVRRARAPRPVRALPAAPPEHGLPLEVGDVVVRGKRELWLTGALLLLDGVACKAAVFLASESAARRAEAIVVTMGAAPKLAWVECEQDDAQGGLVSDALEGEGETLARRARLPVRIERRGAVPGELEAAGTWVHYEASSGAVAFVLHAGKQVQWRGTWLLDGEWMRLAAGGATLREL